MPVRAGLSSDCFIAILTDPEAGFLVVGTDGERLVLEKPGHDPPIILRQETWYGPTEINDWIAWSDIGWDLFDILKAKYCPEEVF